jgi:hypothetical protein
MKCLNYGQSPAPDTIQANNDRVLLVGVYDKRRVLTFGELTMWRSRFKASVLRSRHPKIWVNALSIGLPPRVST